MSQKRTMSENYVKFYRYSPWAFFSKHFFTFYRNDSILSHDPVQYEYDRHYLTYLSYVVDSKKLKPVKQFYFLHKKGTYLLNVMYLINRANSLRCGCSGLPCLRPYAPCVWHRERRPSNPLMSYLVRVIKLSPSWTF